MIAESRDLGGNVKKEKNIMIQLEYHSMFSGSRFKHYLVHWDGLWKPWEVLDLDISLDIKLSYILYFQ